MSEDEDFQSPMLDRLIKDFQELNGVNRGEETLIKGKANIDVIVFFITT
jgi:hypothetical protein